MADEERDPRVSQRYRSLGREEPPRGVDEAILAAARRAAETRPAPLVVPSGRRRWYFPLAAAAIIVLAVAVTVHVERQQPDPEIAIPPVTAPQARQEEQAVQSERAAEPVKPAARPAAPMFTPDPKPGASRELRAQRDAVRAESQTAPAPTPAPASPPAADRAGAASGLRDSRRPDAAAERQVLDAARAKPAPLAKLATEPPEQWLERIAELRKREKHEEADKQLEEFRKRYPDYRISDAMLEKVEKK